MTVQEHIIEVLLDSNKKKLDRMLEIKAPDSILLNISRSILDLEENKLPKISGDINHVKNWTFISSETKTGKGGVKYAVYTCVEGVCNWFPKASYGYYIKIVNK